LFQEMNLTMVVDGYSPLVLKTVAVPLYLRMAPFVFEMCLRAEKTVIFFLWPDLRQSMLQ